MRLAVMCDREDTIGEGGSASGSSKAAPSQAAASTVTAIVDLGPLCLADFKVSVGAAGICEEVIHFVAPSYVGDIFRNMSLKGMFQSIEANAAKVVFFLLV